MKQTIIPLMNATMEKLIDAKCDHLQKLLYEVRTLNINNIVKKGPLIMLLDCLSQCETVLQGVINRVNSEKILDFNKINIQQEKMTVGFDTNPENNSIPNTNADKLEISKSSQEASSVREKGGRNVNINIKEEVARTKSCHTDTLYCCYTCYITFDQESDLEYHVLTHHQTSKDHPKLQESESSSEIISEKGHTNDGSNEDPQEHIASTFVHFPDESNELSLDCIVCQKHLGTRNALYKHYRSKHPTYERYKCTKCSQTFHKLSELRFHSKSTHEKATNKFEKCNICQKILSCKRERVRHHKKAHPNVAPFTCNNCKEEFNKEIDFQNHSCFNENNTVEKCHICDQEFSKKHLLNTHMQKHVNKIIRPFNCTQCEKTFSTKYMLNLHIKRHSSNRPFACGVCKKTYALERDLLLHSKYHSDDAFQCEICQKVFNHKKTLWNHMLRHKGNRTHVCEKCGKSFYTSSALKMHDYTHTGYKPVSCSVCGKGFRGTNYLRSHMTIHTGEKPFLCNICGKYFSRRYNLRQHMESHTGVKPLACQFCGKGFWRKKQKNDHEAKCNKTSTEMVNADRISKNSFFTQVKDNILQSSADVQSMASSEPQGYIQVIAAEKSQTYTEVMNEKDTSCFDNNLKWS